ncbi:hypothetical protein, partial [Pseudomonas gregormendelii]|uniref:hypothetical protein n=1 Tax=Pseudomonas gregormendelii TaxID=1628277 RepID=UPI00197E5267
VEVHFFNAGIGTHHGDGLLKKIGSTASAVSYPLGMWGSRSGYLQTMKELTSATRKRCLKTSEIRKPFLHPRFNSHEAEPSLIIPVHSI